MQWHVFNRVQRKPGAAAGRRRRCGAGLALDTVEDLSRKQEKMKKKIIEPLLFFALIFACKVDAQIESKIKPQSVNQIEVYYLPWDLHDEGELNERDVRDFNQNKNSFICIDDEKIINDFLKSMSIFYLRLFTEKDHMDPRMVIDVFFENFSYKETILLDGRQLLQYEKGFYHKNLELARWLETNVPKAKNPFKKN